MRLSLLDQSPLRLGGSVGEALRASIERAVLAEELGLHRIWYAEHRHHAAFVGSSPLTLATAAAQATSTLRVGTGGVLIAANDPAQTAHAFRVLHALHPDRVDAGIGKGAANRTVHLQHLGALVHQLGSEGPPLWLLGSSASSAPVADDLGAGFAYGHFFNPDEAVTALRGRSGPTILAVRVITGSDEAEVLARADAFSAWRTRRSLGLDEPLPRRGQQLAVPREHQHALRRNRAAVVAGTPDAVAGRLRALLAQTGAAEAMVTLPEPDPASAAHQLRLLTRAVASQEERHVVAS